MSRYPVTADETGPAEPSGSLARWMLGALLLVLLLTAAIGAQSRHVTDPVGADAAPDVFSAARAADAVAPVVAQPRPIGTPANDRAREELSAQLTALGFETRTQEDLGLRFTPRYAAAGYNRNLVATRAGTDPTGTIVLATHIDSVPGAPGAADAGVGLAVILETVRALGPEASRNDLVVLLVDGEENGLLGAEAFVREEAAALAQPVVVLNHEARGVAGRPTVTRTAGPMHEVLGSLPHPEFESFTDAVFTVIPNDTDFTEYREAGWWGMDMAIIDDSWAYHTPQDDAAHLDPGTLQHYGDMTLALTRDLTDRDLEQLRARAHEAPVQTTAPWGIVQVPPLLVRILGVAAPVAILALLVIRRRRRELSILGTMLALVGSVVAIGAGTAAGVLLWGAAAQATPEMVSRVVGEPFEAHLFIAAELAAAAAVALAVWVLLRLGIGRAAITTGAALLATGLLAALAVWFPALGGSMVMPAAIAAIGALVATVVPGSPGLVVRALALLPTGWLLGTQLSSLAEFGISSASGGYAGSALLSLAAAAPLFVGREAQQLPARRRPRRLLAPVLAAALTAALVVGGTVHAGSTGEPVQERVAAHIDGADGTTTWEVSGITAWGRGLADATAPSDLPAPEAEVTRLEDSRRVRLQLRSPRDATVLDVEVAGGTLQHVTLDGVAWSEGQALEQLRIVGLRPGQLVVLEADVEDGARLTLSDTSFDPSEAAGWSTPSDGISVVGPAVRVSTTFEL